jgi:hypothetical protein
MIAKMGISLFMKSLHVGRLIGHCPENPYRQIATKKSPGRKKCCQGRHIPRMLESLWEPSYARGTLL